MKKLAIFDLDGTLVSSIDDITRCVNEAFEYFNIPNISADSINNFGLLMLKLSDRCFAPISPK